MAKKVTADMMRLVQAHLAASGGKARAAKYDHAQLSEWARKGGRPKKDQKQSGDKPARGKGRRK